MSQDPTLAVRSPDTNALRNAYNIWSAQPNAAKIAELLDAYAAGELGAIAFIAAVLSMLDAVVLGTILSVTGLTVFYLAKLVGCIVSGGGGTGSIQFRSRLLVA